MTNPGRFLTRNVTLLTIDCVSPSGIVYPREWKEKLLRRTPKTYPGWYEPSEGRERDEFRAFTVMSFWFDGNVMRGAVSAMRSYHGAWFYRALAKGELVFFPVTQGALLSGTTFVDPERSEILGFDALLIEDAR